MAPPRECPGLEVQDNKVDYSALEFSKIGYLKLMVKSWRGGKDSSKVLAISLHNISITEVKYFDWFHKNTVLWDGNEWYQNNPVNN